MNVDVRCLGSRTWVEQEMRERFRWFRENDPVHWSERDQLWLITKFDDSPTVRSIKSSSPSPTACCSAYQSSSA
jgi:hypothetical protein